MTQPPTAARLGAAALFLSLLLGTVTACGSGPASTDAAADGGGSATVEKGAYPVTITHKFGRTTIRSDPKRIVTVGLSDQDAVLALGRTPVATTEWMGEYRGAIGPWARDKAAGHPTPTVLHDDGNGPQMEKIAAQRPDLILALYAGLTAAQYRTLSKIAPVVAQPAGMADYGISWQRQTELAGQALGRPARARRLVDTVEKGIEDAAAAHPGFKGARAVMATPFKGLYVYGPQDNRTRLLHALGFAQPPDLAKVIGPDDFGANISEERTDLLDNDVTVWIMTSEDKDGAALHRKPQYGHLDVVKQGREVFIAENSDYGNAVSFVTVLSIPYTLKRLVPQLTAAADGDPSTEVPRPAA